MAGVGAGLASSLKSLMGTGKRPPSLPPCALTASPPLRSWTAQLDGPSFVAYVEQILAPTLQPGDCVVLDNLACHKVAGVRQALEAVGARLLYLPPYSPDFNPIEQAFAKLKVRLRATPQRTVASLWTAIGQALLAFSSTECANYVRHAGYRLATLE